MKLASIASAAASCALVIASPRARAQDASAPEEVELTVGVDGESVVREVRSAQVAVGESRLRLFDVSPKLEPQTLAVRALANAELLELTEQTAWFELLDGPRALEKLAGRPVVLRRWHAQEFEKLEGRLLFPPVAPGPDGDVRLPLYLEQTDGTIRLLDGAEIELASLPPGEWNRMRLDLRLRCKRADRYRFETVYATRGLAWQSDLLLRVAADGASADFSANATIDNQTGVAWRNAKLSIAEGDRLHPVADGATVEAHAKPQFTLAQAHDVKVRATPTLLVEHDEPTARAAVVRRYDLLDAAARVVTRPLPHGTARVVTLDAQNRPFLAATRSFAGSGPSEPLFLLGEPLAGVVAAVQVGKRPDGAVGLHVRAKIVNDRDEKLDVDVLFPLRVGERLVGASASDPLFTPSIARVAASVAARQSSVVEFDVAQP